MNKAELLAILDDEFDIVIAPQAVPKPPGVELVNEYEVAVYKRDGDKLTPRTIHFYVEDEGSVELEVASWRSSDPTAEPPLTFEDELDMYIEQKVGEGAIEGGFIRYLAALKEFAYGIAIVDNEGVLEEIKVFLDRDAGGEIQHRVVPPIS